MKLIEILKAALTKFSAINLTHYAGIATLVISAWQGAELISPSVVLLLTGVITVILKWWQSSKEMVSSGFSLDWAVWTSGIVGAVTGFIDVFVTDGSLMTYLGEWGKWILMAYMAITIIIRTGYTNQSLNSIAARQSK